jgi:hypothetical protein
MFARSLSLLALTAFVSAAAATQAMACCGCAYTCAPPVPVQIAPVQIWGVAPSYVVNQGPVYSGPGFYTSPTYEGEASTIDYPYVGYGNYPRSWQGALPERPRHFQMFHRHETSVLYRHGFGRHAIVMSPEQHWVARTHRSLRDLRIREY